MCVCVYIYIYRYVCFLDTTIRHYRLILTILSCNRSCQCRAFAKALHYKEMEFEAARSKKMGTNPVTVVESLIHINNQLHQHEVCFTFF